mmetsp:Transcript_24889/g.62225  ORF Transcript_24889/g.62225 Transcript_24889/m.62225 type:complete len:409 (-) Transcript_24889:101-1327(-)
MPSRRAAAGDGRPEFMPDRRGSDPGFPPHVSAVPDIASRLTAALGAFSLLVALLLPLLIPSPSPPHRTMLNQAFVFIKPHAVTPATVSLVEKSLKDHGLTITGSGTKTGAEIDEGKLIDTHYYAIASKATLLKPAELNVPKDKFEAAFGIAWDQALKEGKVFNAMDACKELNIDAAGINKLWGETKKANKLVKFGGGFYCGEVKPGMYVFNGFFMQMRSAFVKPDASIKWYTVEWDSAKLSWSDFRTKVLGPTDPSTAPPTSVRGAIYSTWETLGLASQPNTGDNGVHASASPFEAFAERKNWLGAKTASDAFGAALLAAGLTGETVDAWCKDPAVSAFGGKAGSMWDKIEDTDTEECLKMLLPGWASVGKECPVKLTHGTAAAIAAAFVAVGAGVGAGVGILAAKKN